MFNNFKLKGEKMKYCVAFSIFIILSLSIFANEPSSEDKCINCLRQFKSQIRKDSIIENRSIRGLIGSVYMQTESKPDDNSKIETGYSLKNLKKCADFGLDLNILVNLDYIFKKNSEDIYNEFFYCMSGLFALDEISQKQKNQFLSSYLFYIGKRLGGLNDFFKDEYKINFDKVNSDAENILEKGGYNYKENHILQERIRSCAFFGIELEFIEALIELKH